MMFIRRALLTVYAAVVTVPLAVVVFGTFKTDAELFESPFGLPSGLHISNYTEVLGAHDLAGNFRNSVVVTLSSVTLTVFIASLASFAIARIPGWKGHAIYGAFILGMAVPAQVNMIPQYVIFREMGLTNSLLGLVLINTVVTMPISIFILTGFMKTLPRELYEAAAIDGARPWQTYRSIVMPLSVPALSTLAIFLFVMHWNDLLYPLLFISDSDKVTLPKALLDFKGEYLTDYPLLFTGALIASAPMLLVYVLLQRYFVAGLTAGSVKG